MFCDPWLTSYDYCLSSAHLLYQQPIRIIEIEQFFANKTWCLNTVKIHVCYRFNTEGYRNCSWNLTELNHQPMWVTRTDPWPTEPLSALVTIIWVRSRSTREWSLVTRECVAVHVYMTWPTHDRSDLETRAQQLLRWRTVVKKQTWIWNCK